MELKLKLKRRNCLIFAPNLQFWPCFPACVYVCVYVCVCVCVCVWLIFCSAILESGAGAEVTAVKNLKLNFRNFDPVQQMQDHLYIQLSHQDHAALSMSVYQMVRMFGLSFISAETLLGAKPKPHLNFYL